MPENGLTMGLHKKLFKPLLSLLSTIGSKESEPKVWFVDGPMAGQEIDLPMMTEVVVYPIEASAEVGYDCAEDVFICVTYDVAWFLPQPMAFLSGFEIMA